MKLLVCGDTHGNNQAIACLIRAFAFHRPQLFAHTGDFYRDFQRIREETGVDGYGVTGNCDFGLTEPEEQLFELDGIRVLLVHGHQHRVKRGPRHLIRAARKKGVQLVLFGHNHIPLVQREQGLLLVNPGSLYWPRGGSGPSYALLDTSGGEPRAEIIPVDL